MQCITDTDVGLVRSQNQDTVCFKKMESGTIVVLCDGMGGANAGDLASKMVADYVLAFFEEHFLPEMSRNEIESLLAQGIIMAGQEVYQKSHTSVDYEGMGTTCVAAYVNDEYYHIASVGDSRAYYYKDEKLRQITVDHSVVQELYDRNALTKEEMETDPRKHMLTRAVGVVKNVEVDVLDVPNTEHTKLLLCSDGLSGYANHEVMESVMGHNDLHMARDLIEEAKRNGGGDNITVAIITNESLNI